MAKQYSFFLTTDDGGALNTAKMLLVKDKQGGLDPNPGDFHIYRDGVIDTSIFVTNNGDGSYLFEYTLSGSYTIWIGSGSTGHAAQPELTNIPLIGDDILKAGDVVNNLTSSDTAKPLSAAQGKELQDNKADQSDLDATNTAVGLKADTATLSTHTSGGNPHTGSASATAGTGMKAESSQKLGVNVDDLSIEVGADGKLKVKDGIFEGSMRGSIIYAWNGKAADSDGATPGAASSWRTSNGSFEKKYSTKFIKTPGDEFLYLSIESTPMGSPGAGHGQFKLEIITSGGTGYAEGTLDITDASWRERFGVTLQDLAIGDEITVNVYMKKTSGTGDFGASEDITLFTMPYWTPKT